MDEDEERWLAECAKRCSCCERCAQVPCAGVMQGGFCDRMCWCETDNDWEVDDDR
jgi:hypothetical protein